MPGRAIAPEKQREGFLGIVDRMPLSFYRRLGAADRLELMMHAFTEKKKFERASEYNYKLMSGGATLTGLRDITLRQACKELAEVQKFHANSPRYYAGWAVFSQLDDMRLAEVQLDEKGKLPYIHCIFTVAVSQSEQLGLFTIREQIDGFDLGRDFRWTAYVVDKSGKPREVFSEHAWERHEFLDIQIAEVKDNSFVLRMADGRLLEVS